MRRAESLKTLLTLFALVLATGVPAVAGGEENKPVFVGSNSMLGQVIATSNAMLPAGLQEDEKKGGGGGPEGGEKVEDNGTNPGSLGFKFMPYYRYTKLNNGIKSTDDLALFAMLPLTKISPFTAVVLEWSVGKTMDFGAISEDLIGGGGSPTIPCGPPPCGGSLPTPPPEALARGFDISGYGDFRMRFLQGVKMIPGKKPGKSTVLMLGLDVMLPVASDPILGDETYYGAPLFVHVHNLNPQSFFAFLHFYFFDWGHRSDAHPVNADKEIGFYMGRWFFQKAWDNGYYVLPEMQVIYDNESDADLSVMLLPEFGKSFKLGDTGMTAYIKPGWAIDGPDEAERRFSVEFGVRIIP